MNLAAPCHTQRSHASTGQGPTQSAFSQKAVTEFLGETPPMLEGANIVDLSSGYSPMVELWQKPGKASTVIFQCLRLIPIDIRGFLRHNGDVLTKTTGFRTRGFLAGKFVGVVLARLELALSSLADRCSMAPEWSLIPGLLLNRQQLFFSAKSAPQPRCWCTTTRLSRRNCQLHMLARPMVRWWEDWGIHSSLR